MSTWTKRMHKIYSKKCILRTPQENITACQIRCDSDREKSLNIYSSLRPRQKSQRALSICIVSFSEKLSDSNNYSLKWSSLLYFASESGNLWSDCQVRNAEYKWKNNKICFIFQTFSGTIYIAKGHDKNKLSRARGELQREQGFITSYMSTADWKNLYKNRVTLFQFMSWWTLKWKDSIKMHETAENKRRPIVRERGLSWGVN